jgi:putative ABC transport system permease protein
VGSLTQDVRYALRSLRRAPGFAATVIVTLAIGIGLNAAIFTAVDCVLLRPLGLRDADCIVALQTRFTDENRSIPRLGGDDYRDVAQQVKGLAATGYYMHFADGVAVDGRSLYLPVAMVSPRFAEVLGVEPVAGRLFRSTDSTGTDVLIGAGFARDHFGSAAAALGHAITYSGAVYTVVGVLPGGFSFPEKTELWFEAPATPRIAPRSAYNQQAIGKRRAGVSTASLNAELAAFSAGLQRAYPEDRNKSIQTVPLQDQIVGPVRSTLRLLMGAVALVLLIVCANVTHLQLARATRELRQVTIRAALGASRARLAGRALLEAALLACLGCFAALAIAELALRLLVRMAPPDVPRLADVHLNLDVLLFSFAVSLAVMLLTALLPVWRSWQVDPAAALRQDSARGSDSRRSLRLRSSLIVAEVALTLTLSVSAVLLTRQLIAGSKQDLGFAPDSLITLSTHTILSTPWPDERDPVAAERAWDAINAANLAHLDQLLASVASVPGVESVSAMNGAPMTGGLSNVGYAVKGKQTFAPGAQRLPVADLEAAAPGFTRTLGLPLVRGRSIEAGDKSGAPKVVLINQALARQQFGDADPIGQQVKCGYDEAAPTWMTIVGVVGDMRSDAPGTLPTPTFYIPVAQHAGTAPDVQILVRTRGDAAAMSETLRAALLRTHPEIAVKATTMRENIGETERSERFRSTLIAGFAAVGILLAAL